MRKTWLLLAAAAATLTPLAAQARPGELRHDRQQIREERQELRHARRYGTPQQVREERRDVRHARREYREDRRDYAQRVYRNGRYYYAAPYRYSAPVRYTSFRVGVIAPRVIYTPRYYVNDYYRYRLPAPHGWLRYVRHYNDLLLVNVRTGRVVRVYHRFYW